MHIEDTCTHRHMHIEDTCTHRHMHLQGTCTHRHMHTQRHMHTGAHTPMHADTNTLTIHKCAGVCAYAHMCTHIHTTHVYSQAKPRVSPALSCSPLQFQTSLPAKVVHARCEPTALLENQDHTPATRTHRRIQNPISSSKRKSQFPRVKKIKAICITESLCCTLETNTTL